ncbi:MAG: transglutaminase-like cysteine peptidase [Methylovirgula sp.]|uniref:transglutaminase-like cysteine peptidase n=1 Tax=Methylovirgula sp. TaxID=1978224 RepID=UPI0030764BA3
MGINKIIRTFRVAVALAGLTFIHSQSQAMDLRASTATLTGPTSVPYGWVDFCGREPQECSQPVLAAADLDLTPAMWRLLNSVNRHVNGAIVPISNLDHWGTLLDHWDYPKDGKGDCKIYALWKRKLLMDAGLPRQALLMTIVRDLDGEGHTILTVKTNRGEFILDNLRDDIRPWDTTGYHFLKRQSQENPNIWVGIAAANARVSSLN